MDGAFKLKNGYIELKVNSKIYSKETIFAAGYIFLDRCYILLDKNKDNLIIHLYPKSSKVNKKKVALDFYNELLNYAHYFSRTSTNSDTIKLIMRRALFSAAPSLIEEAQDKEIKKLIKSLEEEENGQKSYIVKKRK